MNRRGMVISGLAAAGAAVVVIAIVASSGGFGSGSRHVVPDLRGQRLDIAQARLDTIGLDSDTKGGGTFGVVVRSHWQVCDEEPQPGTTASTVLLVVARECQWSVPDVTGLHLKEAETRLDREGTPYEVDYPETAGRRARHRRHFTVCDEEPQYGPTTVPVQLTVGRLCSLPDLTDMTLAKALKLLLGSDVAVTAVTDAGRQVWKGSWRVCDQSVSVGSIADRLRLVVYRTCEVPDVTGMTLARAKARLKRVNVAVTARTASNGGRVVCEQDPVAYEPASEVTLTLGRACPGTAPAEPSSAALPYLEGYGVDSARISLDEIGVMYRFVVSSQSRGLDLSYLEVCHQIPPAGAAIPAGAKAVLYVAADCYSEWPDDFRQ